MFERSLSDFPEREPVALSRPSSAEADDAPWVVQFDNLLTPEQAKAMVEACPKLERSLAGDQLSPVRTSTQCWCDDKEGCMGNEVVHDLTLRYMPPCLTLPQRPHSASVPRCLSGLCQLKTAWHRLAPRDACLLCRRVPAGC